MKFTKMQGCGNDYVYVDCTNGLIDEPDKVAIKVSDRHFGIGSDGLILIASSDEADYEMIMYNADGSRGEMCGNGIRCVGKFVYDKSLTTKKHITVNTLGGIKTLDLNVSDGKVMSVSVDMGHAVLEADKIPVISDKDRMLQETITVGALDYVVDCISMGNPHCVVRLDEDVDNLKLDEIGPLFEHHKLFPKRINTEFINVLDNNRIKMRVWERGSGETLACGTGACAAAISCIINGLCDSTVDVELKGGYLTINYDRNSDKVTMTGPATTVFEGEIDV